MDNKSGWHDGVPDIKNLLRQGKQIEEANGRKLPQATH
jgi:hypothetical protein